jgi:hypothetical protein
MLRIPPISQTFPTCSRALLALAAGLLLGPQLQAQAGGIEIFTGETLFSQGQRLSVAHLYESKSALRDGTDTIGDPADQRSDEHRIVAGYNYGLGARLTLATLVPFIDRSTAQTQGGSRQRVDLSGLGDLSILGKYRLWTVDSHQGSVNVAVVGGLELPTGETDATNRGQRVEPGTQLGSGSYDPFASLVFTGSSNRFRVDAQAFYKLNTKGSQEFTDGDLATARISAAYRFWHERYPGPSHSVSLGLLYRHEFRAERDGHLVHNSGFDQLLLQPGLTLHPNPALDIVLKVEVPVFDSDRGQQLGLDYRTFAAVGWRF